MEHEDAPSAVKKAKIAVVNDESLDPKSSGAGKSIPGESRDGKFSSAKSSLIDEIMDDDDDEKKPKGLEEEEEMNDDDDDEKKLKGLEEEEMNDDDEEEEEEEEDESAVVHDEDGEYSSDSDAMPEVVGNEIDRVDYSSEEFTDEKREIYLKWSKKRGGFAIPRFPKVSFFGMLIPATQKQLTTGTHLPYFTDRAIEDNNRNKNEKLKLVRIIKCNFRLVGYTAYYITLEAKDEDTGNNEIYEVEVQARSQEEYEVPIFRKKKKRRRGNHNPSEH